MPCICKNIAFSQDLFIRVEQARGSMKRSTYIALLLDKALPKAVKIEPRNTKKKTRKEVPA